MRPFLPTCTKRISSLTKPALSQLQTPKAAASRMSTGIPATSPTGALNLETKNVETAPGVTLSPDQQTAVASILDLFAGRPSLTKLALWRDDATFTDPLTIATGRDKFSAQWYGLQAAFSEIERLHHSVKDAGNPILMDLKTRYKIKGIGKEQTIQSEVAIHLDAQGKIEKVEDKWDGKLPESGIANAFRHLNAVTVPKMVKVPKNEEEDAKKGN